MQTQKKQIIDAARNRLLAAIKGTLSTNPRYSGLRLSLNYQPTTGKHILSMGGVDLASARERINYRTMDIVLRMKYLNLKPLNSAPRPVTFALLGIDTMTERQQSALLATEVREMLAVIDRVLVDKGVLDPAGE